MFYDFQDLSKHGISPRGLPNEAMLIQLKSGEWQSIGEKIDGYTTLSVSGRELVAPDIAWSNPTGADGGFVTNIQHKQRAITVKYRLNAGSDREYRDKYTQLNNILSNKKLLTFMFNDDPNYYWEGTLTAVETPEPGSNDVISSFTMTCPYPYKRAIHANDYKGDSKVKIINTTNIPTLPESILYTPSADTNNIVIQTADPVQDNLMQIRLEGAFKADETIKIVPLSRDNSNLYVYNIHSGENIADTLTFDSDIEDFRLRKDSVVTASPQGQLEVVFREEAL